jgi:hypothetical protein
VCRQCKRELAANWFAIHRSERSGRRSSCRLGSSLMNSRPAMELPFVLLYLLDGPTIYLLKDPQLHQLLHTMPTPYVAAKHGYQRNICAEVVDKQGLPHENLVAGHAMLSTTGSVVLQPSKLAQHRCQASRSAENVARCARCQNASGAVHKVQQLYVAMLLLLQHPRQQHTHLQLLCHNRAVFSWTIVTPMNGAASGAVMSTRCIISRTAHQRQTAGRRCAIHVV